MYTLFLDTSQRYLIMILEKADHILDVLYKDNYKKHSDNLIENVTTFLKQHKLKLLDLAQIYLASGPGSFVGTRSSFIFALTLRVINPHLTIATISSLLFQAGLGHTLSVLNAGGGKYYLALYNKGQIELEEQFVDQATLKDMQQELATIKKLTISFNYEEFQATVKIKQHFQVLKPYFQVLKPEQKPKINFVKKFI